MSPYQGFQIVVTPALRDAGEELAMQKALKERFPGCTVEFDKPDSLHGRLAVYPSLAMKSASMFDPKSGKTVADEMPAPHMLVADVLKDWGMWY